jgi:hypothetical protein
MRLSRLVLRIFVVTGRANTFDFVTVHGCSTHTVQVAAAFALAFVQTLFVWVYQKIGHQARATCYLGTRRRPFNGLFCYCPRCSSTRLSRLKSFQPALIVFAVGRNTTRLLTATKNRRNIQNQPRVGLGHLACLGVFMRT